MKRIETVWRDSWKPKPKMSITEWAPSRYRLSGQYEASAGPYQLDEYPYMRAILEAFEDPDVEVLTIVASTQVGKTLFVLMALAYVSENDPAPSLICCPDQSSATEFRDRFYANCLESPGLRDRVPPERRWNTRHIDLRSSRIYLAWAGSRQRLRGRPCRYVVLSEIDVYTRTMAGDPVRIAAERTKKFHRSKIIHESTPVGEDSAISAEYESGNRNRLYGRCPKCNRFQELRFFPLKTGPLAGRGGITGIRGDDGELLSKDDARHNAVYTCLSGCKLRDDQKRDLVHDCKWVRDGEDIDSNGNVTGQPARGKRHTSFRLWAIFSDTISFGDIASAYVEHVNRGALAEFFENWLGLRFSNVKKVPKWQLVGRNLAVDGSRGEVPSDSWFITAGGDVQSDGVYWSARAWNRQGNSRLVDWGFLPRNTDDEDSGGGISSDLAQLTSAVLNRLWPIDGGKTSPFGRTDAGVRLFCLDANYRTADVRRWMRANKSKRTRAIIGDTRTVKVADRYRKTRIERTRKKGSQTKGMIVWRVNVNVYKEQVMDKIITGCAGAASLFGLPSDILRTGATYLKQLVNEAKRKVVGSQGRYKFEWVVKSASTGNHAWDTEIYSCAAADMVLDELGLEWNSDQWIVPAVGEATEPKTILDRAARA